MGPWDIFFGLWLTATLLLSLTSLTPRHDKTRDHDLMVCAGIMGGCWLITGYLIARYNPPWSFVANPGLDLAAGFVAMRLYMNKPKFWKLVLTFIYVAQMICHASYFAVRAAGHDSPEAYYRYQLLLSLLFASALACLSIEGGRHVVAWICARLPHRVGAGRHHPARAQGPRP